MAFGKQRTDLSNLSSQIWLSDFFLSNATNYRLFGRQKKFGEIDPKIEKERDYANLQPNTQTNASIGN
jgi:hypothetical protein